MKKMMILLSLYAVPSMYGTNNNNILNISPERPHEILHFKDFIDKGPTFIYSDTDSITADYYYYLQTDSITADYYYYLQNEGAHKIYRLIVTKFKSNASWQICGPLEDSLLNYPYFFSNQVKFPYMFKAKKKCIEEDIEVIKNMINLVSGYPMANQFKRETENSN